MTNGDVRARDLADRLQRRPAERLIAVVDHPRQRAGREDSTNEIETLALEVVATGLGQIYELVTQLRSEAGARQVEGASRALQENGGGLIGVEEAAVAINILTR